MQYIVFIRHFNLDGIRAFGGLFSTIEKAKEICDKWNEKYGTKWIWADYIGIYDDQIDDDYILNVKID